MVLKLNQFFLDTYGSHNSGENINCGKVLMITTFYPLSLPHSSANKSYRREAVTLILKINPDGLSTGTGKSHRCRPFVNVSIGKI